MQHSKLLQRKKRVSGNQHILHVFALQSRHKLLKTLRYSLKVSSSKMIDTLMQTEIRELFPAFLVCHEHEDRHTHT